MVSKTVRESKGIFEYKGEWLDIGEPERRVYSEAMAFGRQLLSKAIEAADQKLAEQRDKSKYRDKGYRRTVLKTVMGEVEYQRHVYVVTDTQKGASAAIYLLDRHMGLDTVGLFSDTVCKMAVEAACAVSYRRAATEINDLTGLRLSHESVWRIVQDAGSWERERVEKLAAAAKAENGAGAYETPVLYEEMDGVYLALQGQDRKEYGSSKELKLSIAYSGIHEDASGRRRLENKVSCAGFEEAKIFRDHAEGVVASYYSVDKIKRRVFNSDGGAWLQRNMAPDCIYQLDLFHRNKAVRTCLNETGLQKTVLELLYRGKVQKALDVIEASIASTDDPTEQEKRRKLYSYFDNNKTALIPYYRRKGKQPPAPNEGQQPARCGSMESNVFTIIGNRMKHNRTCWSVDGGNNLAALLALHHTGRLRPILSEWAANRRDASAYTVSGPLSACQARDRVNDAYVPPHTISGRDLPDSVKYILKTQPLSQIPLT